jgi:hypothetical protein
MTMWKNYHQLLWQDDSERLGIEHRDDGQSFFLQLDLFEVKSFLAIGAWRWKGVEFL